MVPTEPPLTPRISASSLCQNRPHTTALFRAQDIIQRVGSRPCFERHARSSVFVLSAAGAGAQGVDAEVRRRTVQPASHVPIPARKQALAVQPQEHVVGKLLRPRAIAEQAEQYADGPGVVPKVELFERGIRPARTLGFAPLAHFARYAVRCTHDHRGPRLELHPLMVKRLPARECDKQRVFAPFYFLVVLEAIQPRIPNAGTT